jgi:hypothetical protein
MVMALERERQVIELHRHQDHADDDRTRKHRSLTNERDERQRPDDVPGKYPCGRGQHDQRCAGGTLDPAEATPRARDEDDERGSSQRR